MPATRAAASSSSRYDNVPPPTIDTTGLSSRRAACSSMTAGSTHRSASRSPLYMLNPWPLSDHTAGSCRRLGRPESPSSGVRASPQRRVRLQAHSDRSEEHTSELQSLMRISYAVFCLKKKNNQNSHKSYLQHKTTSKSKLI